MSHRIDPTKPSPEILVRVLRKLADALESGQHELLSGSLTAEPMYECLSMPHLPIDADRTDHYAYDYSKRFAIEVICRRVRPKKKKKKGSAP